MPDIYRLKFRLWRDFVKRYRCLPPPQVWSQIRTQIRAQVINWREGTEQVKRKTNRAVPDKENIPLSETGNETVIFKIPLSVPRQHGRQRHPITVQCSYENISPKESIPVVENISAKENISEPEIIPSKTIGGRHLPGSVTVACVTACEKSSNPRQKVGKYYTE